MTTVVLTLSTLACAAFILIEHLLVSQPLAQFENQRRAIGVVTVLAFASIPVLTNVIVYALPTFGYVCALFVVAGAVMFATETIERAIVHAQKTEDLRNGIAKMQHGQLPGHSGIDARRD